MQRLYVDALCNVVHVGAALTENNEQIALGPGGTPSTIAGYLRIKVLSLFALQDPLAPIPVSAYSRAEKGHLSTLPQRRASRPHVRGIAPHRQVTQRASDEMFRQIELAIANLAACSNGLVVGTSCFEK
jgi:hypothetical protein